MQDLPPESQALQNIRVLLGVVVCKTCPTLAALDRQAALRVLRTVGAEVLLEVRDHFLAWIAVDSQEGMIVADAV